MHPCHVNVYVAPSDNTQVTVSSKCGLSNLFINKLFSVEFFSNIDVP